ncbi:ECF transporter S component [Ferdinandcohnia quinoae]|uniref:Riboflavin transporter n=1 Tax=Fredinandcohnia quinoae TaxID=2918902 RepID=A0AAW5E3U3_9BACI|nr:ECF transporter S component [Fredinandcohnia sp. SECRCQ15]MCH1627143.1 ECF transporter S component [Fredinandcohnia sp. SECRCQ15]
MEKTNVRKLVLIGMLSGISYVLMILNFPLPMFPSYLQIDFSDIPALIGALVLGPVAGVLIELIKNIIDYFMTGSETGVPVGHLANFIAGSVFVLSTYLIYHKIKSKKGMTIGLVTGTILMAIVMCILNYYVILPAFTYFLNAPAMSGPEVRKLIVLSILPFNILKGLIITGIFMLIFIRLQTWIKKQTTFKQI